MKKATSRYLLNNKHNSQVAAAKVVFGINIMLKFLPYINYVHTCGKNLLSILGV